MCKLLHKPLFIDMMATFILLLVLSGFYFSYTTSKKQVQPMRLKSEVWISTHSRVSKAIGVVLLLCACILTITYYGLGAGTLYFFIIVMTMGSLVTILRPLNVINYRTIILLAVLSVLLEQAL